jgi:hypothetical protein
MIQSSYVDVEEIAIELHLDTSYVRNFWRDILPGLKPQKTRPKQRKLLFSRHEFQALILQDK